MRICIFSLIVSIGLFAILLNEFYIPHQTFLGSKAIEIPSGFGSRMIADKLKQEGFIRSKWIFELYVTLRGEASSLKPGEYKFDRASVKTIAAALVKGAHQELVITLPEGSNIEDLGQILRTQGAKANAFEIFAAMHTFPELESTFPFLKDTTRISGLEGYLFPDTYHIFANATNEQIATDFLHNFDAKLSPELRQDIRNQNKTIRDIIIMASLIEREVVSDQDRAMVAGVLWKRIAIGMPLQVDATVLYAKEIQNHATQERLTRDDLTINSPYNTYKYRGLPVGPIGNPGLSAITAAIHPTISPYLYYLSAPDGRTIFSRTLDEHNAAKQKYLK